MPEPLPRIKKLSPYEPGLSIAEIQERHGLARVIKLASNENPLGASPLAMEAISKAAASAFRYPQGGNPRLTRALAKIHNVSPQRIAIGNGSDEIIDCLIRIFVQAGQHNILCFDPCFSIYPIQATINGNQIKRLPLKSDFSFDFEAFLNLADENTRLVFLTTPDNPSGYCPPLEDVAAFAQSLAAKAPDALLVIDEAYMDFAPEGFSLLNVGKYPENVIFLRTFSKSYGLAGARLGYAILPENLTEFFWRTRLPFSVSILAEEAGLAALADAAFREATLKTVAEGRKYLTLELTRLGCEVAPSSANFIMFRPPEGKMEAAALHAALLARGIIIRQLKSYGLPDYLRASVGNREENRVFIKELEKLLKGKA